METIISNVALSKERVFFVFLFLHILRHVERSLDDATVASQSQVENVWSGLCLNLPLRVIRTSIFLAQRNDHPDYLN